MMNDILTIFLDHPKQIGKQSRVCSGSRRKQSGLATKAYKYFLSICQKSTAITQCTLKN